LFYSGFQLIGWIHVKEGNLLCSVYQFKCKYHPNITGTYRKMFEQISTHKINYHRAFKPIFHGFYYYRLFSYLFLSPESGRLEHS
jgi:hypothetical protein